MTQEAIWKASVHSNDLGSHEIWELARSISDLVDAVEPVDGVEGEHFDRIGFIADYVTSLKVLIPVYEALFTDKVLGAPLVLLRQVNAYLADRLTSSVAASLEEFTYSSDLA